MRSAEKLFMLCTAWLQFFAATLHRKTYTSAAETRKNDYKDGYQKEENLRFFILKSLEPNKILIKNYCAKFLICCQKDYK
jgi:hypothetical protein